MRIGIDLDNTIICYDEALMDLGSLMGVPRKHASTKQEIKNSCKKMDGKMIGSYYKVKYMAPV